MKKTNEGVIKYIWFHSKKKKLPKDLQLTYTDNKSFIGTVAYIYKQYLDRHNLPCTNDNIISYSMLKYMIISHDIRTSHGAQYVLENHLSVRRLIRAAHKYYSNLLSSSPNLPEYLKERIQHLTTMNDMIIMYRLI